MECRVMVRQFVVKDSENKSVGFYLIEECQNPTKGIFTSRKVGEFKQNDCIIYQSEETLCSKFASIRTKKMESSNLITGEKIEQVLIYDGNCKYYERYINGKLVADGTFSTKEGFCLRSYSQEDNKPVFVFDLGEEEHSALSSLGETPVLKLNIEDCGILESAYTRDIPKSITCQTTNIISEEDIKELEKQIAEASSDVNDSNGKVNFKFPDDSKILMKGFDLAGTNNLSYEA